MAKIKKITTVKSVAEVVTEAGRFGIATDGVAIETVAKELIQKYESRKAKVDAKKVADWQTRIDAIVALVPNAVVVEAGEETTTEEVTATVAEEEIVAEVVETVVVEEKEEENMEVEEDIDVEEFLYGDEEETVVVAEQVETVVEAVAEETEIAETTVVITEEPKAEVQVDQVETVKQEVAVENKKKKEKKKMEKKFVDPKVYEGFKGEELVQVLDKLTREELWYVLEEKGVKITKTAFNKGTKRAGTDKTSLVGKACQVIAPTETEGAQLQLDLTTEATATVTEEMVEQKEEAVEENPIRARLAELGVIFTDERYAVLSIEDLTSIFNIVNKTAIIDTVVDDGIPLESVKEEKTTEVVPEEPKVETPIVPEEPQTQTVVTEVIAEEPKVETATEQAKEVVDEAPKTTEPKKQTTTRLATIEEAWTASNATKVMKRIVGMAQKNYCINFISDFMVTSAIHEVLFGRPTKNYKTGEVSTFTAEEEALTSQFKVKFVEQYLIPNDKGTGYTIKSMAMAWNYKDVLYRYRGKDKDGKELVVDYIVNYKDKTLQMRGSENVHVLNTEAFAKLDRTCMFINVVKKSAPKGADNAPTVAKQPSYKERMDALIAESEAKVKTALESDDATVKETLANELKAIATNSDRIVEKKLMALVNELMGKQVA